MSFSNLFLFKRIPNPPHSHNASDATCQSFLDVLSSCFLRLSTLNSLSRDLQLPCPLTLVPFLQETLNLLLHCQHHYPPKEDHGFPKSISTILSLGEKHSVSISCLGQKCCHYVETHFLEHPATISLDFCDDRLTTQVTGE